MKGLQTIAGIIALGRPIFAEDILTLHEKYGINMQETMWSSLKRQLPGKIDCLSVDADPPVRSHFEFLVRDSFDAPFS